MEDHKAFHLGFSFSKDRLAPHDITTASLESWIWEKCPCETDIDVWKAAKEIVLEWDKTRVHSWSFYTFQYVEGANVDPDIIPARGIL